MNFLLSANNNYILPLVVCITSILENHKNEETDIYILQNDFTEENKNLLKILFKKYNKNIFLIDVAEHYYDNVPILRWSKETYYRLLFNELLPTNLDRILYLDCDIIVDKNIKDFYYLNLNSYCLGAFPYSSSNFRELIGLKSGGDYFQAGVILFDLNKSRYVIGYEKSLEIIKKIGSNLISVDQDVINVAFDGKIKTIKEKYNNYHITNFNAKNLNRIFNYTNKKEIDHTSIFHYATGKPWNNLFSGSCEDIWYKYLLLSPYSYLYKEKFGRLKYKILRSGLIKYFLFLYIHITPFIDNFFKVLLPKKIFFHLKSFYRKNIK